MPNRFNSKIGRDNMSKAGGAKLPARGHATSSASLNMKNKSYPGLPGKGGPNRSAGFGKPLKQHPQDKGLG